MTAGSGDDPNREAAPAVAAPPDGVRFRTAVRTDFAHATWPHRLALVGVVGWLIYEWGPGNETVTPWLLASVIGRNTGILSIAVTAAVGFTFTTLQQLASGFTALFGFSMFGLTSRAAWNRLQRNASTAPDQWSRMGWGARCALVFGTTAVVLVQITASGEVGVRRHASVVVRSALLCGTLVGVIGALAAGVAVVGRRVSRLSGATEWVLRVLGNPLFWFGIVVCGVLIKVVQQKAHRAR
jgi:hypothetical protein